MKRIRSFIRKLLLPVDELLHVPIPLATKHGQIVYPLNAQQIHYIKLYWMK